MFLVALCVEQCKGWKAPGQPLMSSKEYIKPLWKYSLGIVCLRDCPPTQIEFQHRLGMVDGKKDSLLYWAQTDVLKAKPMFWCSRECSGSSQERTDVQ